MHPHLAGDVPQHHMTVLQLHAEGGVGKVFNHLALHLNDIVFGHVAQAPIVVLKLAFLSSDSYCWLIIVVVTMDFMSQVQNYMMSQQYESLLKKANFKTTMGA